MSNHSISIPELELSINTICNLQCEQCGFYIPHQPKPTISTNIVQEHKACLTILERLQIEIGSLAILGGEPTLTPILLEKATLNFSELINTKIVRF